MPNITPAPVPAVPNVTSNDRFIFRVLQSGFERLSLVATELDVQLAPFCGGVSFMETVDNGTMSALQIMMSSGNTYDIMIEILDVKGNPLISYAGRVAFDQTSFHLQASKFGPLIYDVHFLSQSPAAILFHALPNDDDDVQAAP